MDSLDVFIPNRDAPTFYPLRSYLRVPPASVAEKYIAMLTAPGDLVIDPFACTPTIAQVAQTLGRRAIAVESNPLWSWLARAMATQHNAPEIDAAFARLGDALKDDVPLRAHIDQLYATQCAACHQWTPADYFIHARDAGPIQRHYTCVHCGATRDDSAAEDDLKRAKTFEPRGFHFHFAFERVAPAENLHAERIRKILDTYTPRNLYALVTLTIKIDALFRAGREREILFLLLLHLLDRGTSFYTNASPETIAQLTTHKQFVEFNLWREMERAARALGRESLALDPADSALQVVQSETPRGFVGRGSARTLVGEIPNETAALTLAAPPSRRLAVWVLSYCWGAWILGRAAVQSLVPFLDSDKTDAAWERRWYFDSLTASLNAIAKLSRSDARAVFVFIEAWHEAIEALLLTASAKFDLENFLFQPRLDEVPRSEFDDIRGDYRIVFAKRERVPREKLSDPELEKKIRTAALDGGKEILTRRGEPLAFSWLHHAAYARLAHAGLLTQAVDRHIKTSPGRFVFQTVREGLSEGYAHDFDHYESPGQFVWLRRAPADPPLIDRVDDAVRELLSRGAPMARQELEDEIYRKFSGDLTPEAGLIELCANAYADERDGAWRWRAGDIHAERSRAFDLLVQLGERVEYAVERGSQPFDLAWKLDRDVAHGFIWRDRASFADLARIHVAPARGYLVIPEAQVSLLQAKVRRLPHLADAFREAGWDFVRVPFVEKILQTEKIERHDVMLMAGLVPPVAEEKAQLELF